MAVRVGANVLCEKPLALSPWNLDALEHAEIGTGKRVYTVLQLRLLKRLAELRPQDDGRRHIVHVDYSTPRGNWYQHSWKADAERSGGIITNIGIHLLDLLLWLYGPVDMLRVTARTDSLATGTLALARADVSWNLSIASDTVAIRRIVVDGVVLDFSDGFSDLHRQVYEQTLQGNGFTIADARPAVELAYRLRSYPVR
jgi:UDP-N-acetyl-2-amino-2-deoxyglucuronate dehydrogenase